MSSFDKLYEEISNRLAQKEKHKDLLRILIECLREGGDKAVKGEIKDLVVKIKEA